MSRLHIMPDDKIVSIRPEQRNLRQRGLDWDQRIFTRLSEDVSTCASSAKQRKEM